MQRLSSVSGSSERGEQLAACVLDQAGTGGSCRFERRGRAVERPFQTRVLAGGSRASEPSRRGVSDHQWQWCAICREWLGQFLHSERASAA